MRLALAATIPLVLSGCVATLLELPGESHLAFACRVLAADEGGVELQVWRGEGVSLDLENATRRLALALANATGRDASAFAVDERDGPEAPKSGWNLTLLETWSLERAPQPNGDPILHIVWVSDLAGTGARLGPGAIALSQAAVLAASQQPGREPTDIAAGITLHFAGHALGIVNDGIPVQDPNLQEREGPPNHEPDPSSVMHADWHQASTIHWGPNATLQYSDGIRQDWQAAVDGGVCA